LGYHLRLLKLLQQPVIQEQFSKRASVVHLSAGWPGTVTDFPGDCEHPQFKKIDSMGPGHHGIMIGLNTPTSNKKYLYLHK
jgi:hypothetical protein